MQREPKKEKKLMAVQGDLAHRVIELANRKGMTVFNYTNEIFEAAMKAEELNLSLKDIVERFVILQIERDSGTVFTTKEIFFFMMENLFHKNKDDLLKKCYDSGLWYGKYLKLKFNSNDKPIEMLRNFLSVCYRDSSEIQFSKEDEKLFLNRLSAYDSPEYTLIVSKFLEGIVHSFGYETVKNDVSKGLINIEFKNLKNKVST